MSFVHEPEFSLAGNIEEKFLCNIPTEKRKISFIYGCFCKNFSEKEKLFHETNR